MPAPVTLTEELSIAVTLSGPTAANATLSESLTSTVGIPGLRGATWYSGAGSPDDSIGSNGDYYLNETSGEIFKKASGVYSSTGGNLKGPQGDPGEGVPTGGSLGQALFKQSGTDYDTAWDAAVLSVFGRTGAVSPADGDLDNTAINMQDKVLSRPLLSDVAEQVEALGDTTTTLVLNYSNGPVHSLELTGDVTTVNFTNWPASGRHARMTVYVDSGTGGHGISGWPAAITWHGGSPPDLSVRPAGIRDVLVFTTLDSGANIYGVWVTAPAP